MARSALVAAAAAGAAALAASATSGAAGTGGSATATAANRAPVASLRAKHWRVRVGKKVLLDSSRSRDPDGRIVVHLWDLDGDGVYERSSGRRARIRHAFHKRGKVRVGVLVVDDGGAYATRRVRLRAVPAANESRRTGTGSRRAKKHRRSAHVRAATNGGGPKRKTKLAKSTTPTVPAAQTLHAAAAGGSSDVKISNFKFNPKSITVKVGDTVVWTNDDTVGHTATADDGSFDTGLLSKGATGSFTFTKVGTFSYHCTPHSYMKASVTVTKSGGGSSSGTISDDSGGSGSSSSSTSSNLPHTGLEIASVILAGLALLGGGEALRRRLTRP